MQERIWKKENSTRKTDLRHRVCDTAGTPKSEVSEMRNVSRLQSFPLMGWVTLSFHCIMLWAEPAPDMFCLRYLKHTGYRTAAALQVQIFIFCFVSIFLNSFKFIKNAITKLERRNFIYSVSKFTWLIFLHINLNVFFLTHTWVCIY